MKAWASLYLVKSRSLCAEIVMSIALVIKGFKFSFSVSNIPVQFSNKAGTSFMGAKNKAQGEFKQNSWNAKDCGFSANWVVYAIEAP